jgi:hypothetical protein
VGIDLVVVGLATVAGLHRQRVPEATSDPCAGPQVGQPVPGEDTCDTDDEGRPRGCDGLEQGCWPSGPIPVQPKLTGLTQDTDVHGAGMQLDTAVKWVLLRIEAPEVSSSLLSDSLPLSAYHGGMLGRGLNKYQRRPGDGLQPRLTPGVRPQSSSPGQRQERA